VLLALLNNNGPHKSQIMVTALNALTPASLAKTPAMKAKLNEALDYVKGRQEFVDLVAVTAYVPATTNFFN
jgi:hypothetical protein